MNRLQERDVKKRAAKKQNGYTDSPASLTIEATFSLTIFMFMVILLMMPMQMLNTQRRVQMVLEVTARELSQYAYIRYRLSQGDETIGEGQSEQKEVVFEKAAVCALLAGKISALPGNLKIEKLNFSKTQIDGNGEIIDLYVEYRLKLPFSVFHLDSVPAVARSLRRGWVGSDGGRRELLQSGDGAAQMVYVGSGMGRYHRYRDCHYISNNIAAVPYESVENKLSTSGAHYKPCSVCGKKVSGGTVYILPNGSYYHERKNCSSLAYYVREVPLSEVAHLGECSYCGQMKGK